MTADDAVLDPRVLREAVLVKLDRRVRTQGELVLPAAPSLLEVYIERLSQMFASLGKALSHEEVLKLSDLLGSRLREGFETSAACRVHLKWESEAWPATGLDYLIWLESMTLQEQYDEWAASKEPPLFGAHPDAKVMAVTETLGHLGRERMILDVGAGTGRNTLPLARLGYSTHALEITERFCAAIEAEAQAEALPIKVVRGSALDAQAELARGDYALVVCSEVTTHFCGQADLRKLFEQVREWLCVGGLFLVNAFVAHDGYEPDPIVREISRLVWSTIYTRDDLAASYAGLGLELVSDEAVYAYEKQRLPEADWPPTGWFEDWTRGYNCFSLSDGTPPMQLRWLLFRRV
jgi:SAM-dependent methyltransferase